MVTTRPIRAKAAAAQKSEPHPLDLDPTEVEPIPADKKGKGKKDSPVVVEMDIDEEGIDDQPLPPKKKKQVGLGAKSKVAAAVTPAAVPNKRVESKINDSAATLPGRSDSSLSRPVKAPMKAKLAPKLPSEKKLPAKKGAVNKAGVSVVKPPTQLPVPVPPTAVPPPLTTTTTTAEVPKKVEKAKTGPTAFEKTLAAMKVDQNSLTPKRQESMASYVPALSREEQLEFDRKEEARIKILRDARRIEMANETHINEVVDFAAQARKMDEWENKRVKPRTRAIAQTSSSLPRFTSYGSIFSLFPSARNTTAPPAPPPPAPSDANRMDES